VVLAEADTMGPAEFPQITAQVAAKPGAPGGQPDQAHQSLVPELSEADLDRPEAVPAALQAATLQETWSADLAEGAAPSPGAETLRLLDDGGDVRPLDEIEAELIRYAVTHYRGQMSEVARRLRIGRSTLYRKLDALGLNGERAEVDSPGVAAERQGMKIAAAD
jgi:DNA-binding NtrC family response regulator